MWKLENWKKNPYFFHILISSNFSSYRLNWPQSCEKRENCSEKGERFKKLCPDMKILFLVVTTNTALPARILSLTVTNLITTRSQRTTLTLKLCKETIWTKTIDKNQSKMSFSIILFLKGGKINEPWNKHMYWLFQKLNSTHNIKITWSVTYFFFSQIQ